MKKILILILCLLMIGCGRWKITKFKPDLAYTIASGEEPGKIMLRYDNDEILDMSFDIKIYENNIYTIDNILNRIQKLDRNGEPKICIGEISGTEKETSGIICTKFQFSIIKDLVVDSKSNIYVQNSILPSKNPNQKNDEKDIGVLPSYILIFNDKGTLVYTLGRTGSPDIPFNSVEDMKIDSSDRLFVITRSFDTWSIYRFVNRKRNFIVNFRDNDFSRLGSDDGLTSKIEKIIVFDSGDELLISVAYYENIEFTDRKIFSYSMKTEKVEKTVLEISKPENELFELINDKNIYLWDIDDNNVRYKIANFEGSIINNVVMKFPDLTDSYNEIFIDDKGLFYSYHAGRNGIKIMEWL